VVIVDFVLNPDLKGGACGARCRSIMGIEPGGSELISEEYELMQL
jgi:hypothetical protein